MSEEVENAEFSEANPLAEVISIQGVFNHPNADLLDLVSPDGSGVNFAVVKRGDFIAGQSAIWIDSVNDPMVPVDHPFFAHMAKAAKKDGYARVKTMRLRGIVSRGLLVPLPAEWVGKTNLEISSLLKMKKYIPPAYNYGCSIQAGQAIPGPQNFLPTGKYDVGSLNRGWKDIPDGADVYITEKIHGANGCYGWLNYEGELKFWARSRTLFKKPPEGEYGGGLWWQVAAREGLEEKLKAKPGYVIYGELYGPVQDLRYGESEARFVAFDCWDSNKNRYLPWPEFKAFCQEVGIRTVPEIAALKWSAGNGIPAEIVSMAEGKTLLSGDNIREGIVLRWDGEEKILLGDELFPFPARIIYKLVGNGYLTR